MIEKYFLEKSLAIKVKEVGFNEPCIMYWDNKDELKPHNPPYFYTNNVFISTPMIDQLLDWFYNNYGMHGYIEQYENGWAYCIIKKEYEFFSGASFLSRDKAIKCLLDDLFKKMAI
jgi:hypothetical protein